MNATKKRKRLHCDQCEMLSVNGVPCHETGCPNSRKTWNEDRQEWVRYFECDWCGAEVEEGEQHDCRSEEEN